MITQGQIIQIDFTSNTCVVHVPLFETAGSDKVKLSAHFSLQPGMFNGYVVGDMVWVGFENDQVDRPVVMGKIYQGVNIQSVPRGAISCAALKVESEATLPISTVIVDAKGKPVMYGNQVMTLGTIKSLIEEVRGLIGTLTALSDAMPPSTDNN